MTRDGIVLRMQGKIDHLATGPILEPCDYRVVRVEDGDARVPDNFDDRGFDESEFSDIFHAVYADMVVVDIEQNADIATYKAEAAANDTPRATSSTA